MRARSRGLTCVVVAFLGLLSDGLEAQTDMGAAFTYQGQLKQAGAPMNSIADFRFSLWNAATEGSQIGSTAMIEGVAVSNGLFTVLVDFGAGVFDGNSRWVEIAVRPGGSQEAFTTLLPRQAITATPYALHAVTAGAVPGGIRGSGTTGHLPQFLDASTLGNSAIFEASGKVGIGTTDPGEYSLHVKGLNRGVYGEATAGTQSARPYGVVAGVKTNAVTNTGGGFCTLIQTATDTPFVGYVFGQNISIADDGDRHVRGVTVGLSQAEQDDYGLELVVEDPAYSIYSQGSGPSYLKGKVGIGTPNPTSPLTVNGVIQSTSGGFKFPDGSVQASACATDLAQRVAGLEARIAQLESTVQRLEGLLAGVTRGDNEITFSGVNVHVVNGAGTTDGGANGLGNLIVGYNELRGQDDDRSGSHNIVVGKEHSYSSCGGLVAGRSNTVSAPYASVTGGMQNKATAEAAAVTGGYKNKASASASQVCAGEENEAIGIAACVSGGKKNKASGSASQVAAGRENEAAGEAACVAGGEKNAATGVASKVGGGAVNLAAGFKASVAGGMMNKATGEAAAVGAGVENEANQTGASVVGGRKNKANGDYAAVVGGGGVETDSGNEAFAHYSVVVGGDKNMTGDLERVDHLIGLASTVMAGTHNRCSATCAAVSGGRSNTAGGAYSAIGGGYLNTASAEASTVAGGKENTASGEASSVSGGANQISSGQSDWSAGGLFQGVTRQGNDITFSGVNVHLVSGAGSTLYANGLGNLIVGYNETRGEGVDTRTGSHNIVVGSMLNYSSYGGLCVGYWNEVANPFASVLGGTNNAATGWASVVLGGFANEAVGQQACVGGGRANVAAGTCAAAGGGDSNKADGDYSSVSGGQYNTATAFAASVNGDRSNSAKASWSSVGGGSSNEAAGQYSTVSGGYGRGAADIYNWVAGALWQAE